MGGNLLLPIMEEKAADSYLRAKFQARPTVFSRRSILPVTSASLRSQGLFFWQLYNGAITPVTIITRRNHQLSAAETVYNKLSSIWNNRLDMLGCELLDGCLRLLLESQSSLAFAGILHHLDLHLFAGRKQISHQGNRSRREWKSTQSTTHATFPH